MIHEVAPCDFVMLLTLISRLILPLFAKEVLIVFALKQEKVVKAVDHPLQRDMKHLNHHPSA